MAGVRSMEWLAMMPNWATDVDSAPSIGGLLVLLLALLVGRACIFLRPLALDLDGQPLPGPPAALLMGNWSDIKRVKTGRNFDSATRGMLELYQAHGEDGIVCLRLFSKLIVMCHSPSAVKDVLTASHDKFPKNIMYRNLEYALGKGLVTANGEQWRAHRRIVEKAFHRSALHAMLPCFARHTAELLDSWTARTRGHLLQTDVHTEMTHLTLDIIADAGFGHQLGSKRTGGESHPICCAVTALIKEMNMRFKDMNPLDRYLSLQRWIAGNKAYNTVSELVDEVLRDKQAEFATAAAERRRGGVAKQPLKEMSLLDHLLQARLEEGEKHLTPKELRDEVMTFLGCECLHQSRQSTAGYSTGL